jgi:hypothetical protein
VWEVIPLNAHVILVIARAIEEYAKLVTQKLDLAVAPSPALCPYREASSYCAEFFALESERRKDSHPGNNSVSGASVLILRDPSYGFEWDLWAHCKEY